MTSMKSFEIANLGKDTTVPLAQGLEHNGEPLLTPYCPPYYPSMEAAVQRDRVVVVKKTDKRLIALAACVAALVLADAGPETAGWLAEEAASRGRRMIARE